MCTICNEIEHLKKRVTQLEAEAEQTVRLFTEIKGIAIKEVYSPKEVAAKLGMSYDHVRDLCFSGRLEAFRDTNRGHYMIKHSSLLAFINKKQAHA